MNKARPYIAKTMNKESLTGHRIGLIISILLTVFSFALVFSGLLSRKATIAGICIAGVVQILAHLHYFLNLDASREERWNLMSILFTVLIMSIFIGGTLWVMFTLNYRMM